MNMLFHTKSLRCALMLALLLFAGLPAYAQEGGAMPPAAVSVLTLDARPVPVVSELPGRIAATRVSEVRARVSGILQERVFEQGSLVQQGDVLYRIDPALFRVRVASAEASLERQGDAVECPPAAGAPEIAA
ncbi:multidrug efflux pump subunit AcrA (membrane-fusion protein) [Rhizobium leguminosarum]|nr:multidrug efflux pump subunit AcrA (membrane-fusion protein) [Rhizobium leguminosarum]